jgi:vitamin K-dependent gamma-carboxylase-like protein
MQWREFWLPPSGPLTLAAVRIIVAVQALWILLSRDPSGVSALPPVLWQEVLPEWHFRFLLTQGIPGIELTLWCAAIVSVACVMVGYRTRIFGFAATLLLYHLAPLQALLNTTPPWGKGLTIAIMALPILACSPCEDRWSVANRNKPVPIRDAATYGWAVLLIRLLFAQIYLFSVLARFRAGGWEWIKLETVRNHLLVFGLAEPTLDTPFNAWLASHPLLCAAIAAGTLFFELFFIVAVFVPVARIPLAIAGVLFHTSLWVTLGFRFPNLPHFLMFIDFNGEGKRTAIAKKAAEDNAVQKAPEPA